MGNFFIVMAKKCPLVRANKKFEGQQKLPKITDQYLRVIPIGVKINYSTNYL
jgi:hypothetical protein